LVKYPNRDERKEMLDLDKNPYEIKNLINDPAHAELKVKLESEFKKQAELAGRDLLLPVSRQEPAPERKKKGKNRR